MELTEMYGKLAAHQIKGMMVHEQMANYYDFLGLKGYKECHEYHFLKETMGYRQLNRYFIEHHNKLIPSMQVDDPEIIPENWYDHEQADVDSTTRKNAVKAGLTKWVEWEKETKELYQQMYGELCDLGEVASAMFVQKYVQDVDNEYAMAQGYLLNKEAIGFDMSVITAEQKKKHHKYAKLIKDVLDEH